MAWGIGEINSYLFRSAKPGPGHAGKGKARSIVVSCGDGLLVKVTHTTTPVPLIASAAQPQPQHTHTYTLSSVCFPPLGQSNQGLSLSNTAATSTICGLGSTHTGLPWSHRESLDCDSGHKQWQISGPLGSYQNPGPLKKKKKKSR